MTSEGVESAARYDTATCSHVARRTFGSGALFLCAVGFLNRWLEGAEQSAFDHAAAVRATECQLE